MFDANLTLRDLGWLAVFVTVVVAGFFLIRALMHLGGVLRAVKKLVAKNADGIDKVLKDLPSLSENAVNLTDIAADVADNLRNEQEIIETALESISDTIESVSDTARAINEDFIGSIKRLAKTLMSLAGFFTKKKTPGTDAADTAVQTADGATGTDIQGTEDVVIKKGARERKAKKPRRRGAGAAPRRKYADKGRNINIHIR